MAAIGLRAEADRAELARARRDVEAERAARERAEGFLHAARRWAADAGHPALAATAEADYTRAEGRSDPARWDVAARAWDDRGSPYQAARARQARAEVALASRDRVGATTALRAAHAAAVNVGAAGLRAELEALARRARIELRDGGAGRAQESARGAAAAAGLGLTAREEEVLAHIALGETNRQIADDLFISVKTASLHVSHILAKLGATNRGEAAAIAHRLRIVP
jgi:DNA-binding CsgD family transcriptional regulator